MKVVIHKEVEVTGCANCPYNKRQHDGARGETWRECHMPFCVLTGKPNRKDLLLQFLLDHGTEGFESTYKETGLSVGSVDIDVKIRVDSGSNVVARETFTGSGWSIKGAAKALGIVREEAK